MQSHTKTEVWIVKRVRIIWRGMFNGDNLRRPTTGRRQNNLHFWTLENIWQRFSNMIHTQCVSYQHEMNMWSSYTDYENFENPATYVVFHRNIIDQHPMQQGCSDFLRFDADRFVIIHYQYYAFDLFLPVWVGITSFSSKGCSAGGQGHHNCLMFNGGGYQANKADYLT